MREAAHFGRVSGSQKRGGGRHVAHRERSGRVSRSAAFGRSLAQVESARVARLARQRGDGERAASAPREDEGCPAKERRARLRHAHRPPRQARAHGPRAEARHREGHRHGLRGSLEAREPPRRGDDGRERHQARARAPPRVDGDGAARGLVDVPARPRRGADAAARRHRHHRARGTTRCSSRSRRS